MGLFTKCAVLECSSIAAMEFKLKSGTKGFCTRHQFRHVDSLKEVPVKLIDPLEPEQVEVLAHTRDALLASSEVKNEEDAYDPYPIEHSLNKYLSEMITHEAAPANSKKRIVNAIVDILFQSPELLGTLLHECREEARKLAQTINLFQVHLSSDCGADNLNLPRVEQLLSALNSQNRRQLKGQLKQIRALSRDATKLMSRLLCGLKGVDRGCQEPEGLSTMRRVNANAIVVTPCGNFVIIGTSDNVVLHWNISEDKLETVHSRHTAAVNTVVFSPRESYLLTGSEDHSIIVYNYHAGKHVAKWNDHHEPVNCLALAPVSQVVASGDCQGQILVWSLSDMSLLRRLSGHKEGVRSLCFASSDGLLSGGQDRFTKLWDLSCSDPIWEDKMPRTVRALAYSAEYGVYAVGGSFKDIILINYTDLSKPHTYLDGHRWGTNSLAFDQHFLVSGGSDRNVHLYELKTSRILQVLEGHDAKVLGVYFSASRDLIISAGLDKTVRVWNIETPHFTRKKRKLNEPPLNIKQL